VSFGELLPRPLVLPTRAEVEVREQFPPITWSSALSGSPKRIGMPEAWRLFPYLLAVLLQFSLLRSSAEPGRGDVAGTVSRMAAIAGRSPRPPRSSAPPRALFLWMRLMPSHARAGPGMRRVPHPAVPDVLSLESPIPTGSYPKPEPALQ
jgi:hypothetical protein